MYTDESILVLVLEEQPEGISHAFMDRLLVHMSCTLLCLLFVARCG
jgi:hypothetical protein